MNLGKVSLPCKKETGKLFNKNMDSATEAEVASSKEAIKKEVMAAM